jgi:hypothetical protein
MIVKKHYNKTIIFLCVGGLLTLAGIWFFWSMPITNKIAPFQKTDEWSQWKSRLPEGVWAEGLLGDPDIPIEKRPGILIRTDASNNLLLKYTYGSEIYYYSRETKVITPASEDSWTKGTGEISYCSSHLYEKVYNPEIRPSGYPAYDLRIRGSVFKTRGNYTINAMKSFSHKKVAIITADGPVSSGGWSISFGLGGGEPTVSGRRYVEIIEPSKLDFIQEPVGLIFTGNQYLSSLCWSSNENYVVAYKPYENFSIIEIDEKR